MLDASENDNLDRFPHEKCLINAKNCIFTKFPEFLLEFGGS